MPEISIDQLRTLRDIADELDRLGSAEDQIGSPAAYYLKQMDSALPDLARRLRALVLKVQGQASIEARF